MAAWPDRVFTGKVTAINPSIDPASRMFRGGGAIRQPGRRACARECSRRAKVMLPGGENARIRAAHRGARATRPPIPTRCSRVENGVARLRVVVTGEAEGDSIRILSAA